MNEWFVSHAQASAIVSVQDPIVLNDRTELYPDLALLARRDIAEVWVVDLPARAIDIYRQPSGDAYRDTIRAVPGEFLGIPHAPGLRIGVDEILPPADR